jgi:hypothetical protein
MIRLRSVATPAFGYSGEKASGREIGEGNE